MGWRDRLSGRQPDDSITQFKEARILSSGGKHVLHTQAGIMLDVVRVHRGGIGIVYIAVQRREWRIFAVKTLQHRFIWNEELIKRFVREAEIWVNLGRHQNIVRAYWVEEIEGKPHIFMEYVDGGDFRRLITDGLLDIPKVIDFATQVCSGLEYAHKKQGIVHRDIKPENVLITSDGVAKVSDFGMAGITEEIVEGGTPCYMSPEQFADPVRVDTRSDIYSFGVMLYEMLTGTTPFAPTRAGSEGEMLRELAAKHLHGVPKDPRDFDPGIPAKLALVPMRCLEKNPERRYDSFVELKEVLAALYLETFGRHYVDPAAPIISALDWYAEGVSLAALGKYELAIDKLDRALDMDPEQHWALSVKAGCLFDLGRYEQAIVICDQALRINPRSVQSLENKGLSLHYIGRDEEAITYFDEALKIDPNAYRIWHSKGLALSDVGKDKQAIACYDNALKIDAKAWEVWNSKGGSLNSFGRYQEAIECYDKALQINAKDYRVWHNKAHSLSFLDRQGEAITCCDIALEINPRDDRALCYKGACLGILERYQEAIECLDKALAINATDALAWECKGICLEKLGRYRDAETCYEQARSIDPRPFSPRSGDRGS